MKPSTGATVCRYARRALPAPDLAEKEVQASLYFWFFRGHRVGKKLPDASAPSLNDNFRDVITEHHRNPVPKYPLTDVRSENERIVFFSSLLFYFSLP